MPEKNPKLEAWKSQLLDLGKRNRLINFKETKRGCVEIISPAFEELFEVLVQDEKALQFPCPQSLVFDDDGEELFESVVPGDLETNKSAVELQKTLKILRSKAKESIEEQGINTLYLSFGMIKWNENELVSSQLITSPLLLVPVSLSIESVTSPYVLSIHEDEIIINPSLKFKFLNDFGIDLPDFDEAETSVERYLNSVKKYVSNKNWVITKEVNLSLLSFLKINMYRDLDKHESKIMSNPIIEAISGRGEGLSLNPEYNNYDHDKFTKPVDTFQVVDADSSQQDAILLSKKGVSFVLQGPPGTGKSQTITNIISEALADGKKILFVAEKMAALQVVHKRLSAVGLNDFCLTLHSHKANKKEILAELNKTLHLDKIKVRDEALYQLKTLEQAREKLNQYNRELHTVCSPLNKTIYEVNGEIAHLKDIPEIIFPIQNISQTDMEQLNQYKYLLDTFSHTIGKMTEDYCNNPWQNAIASNVPHELRHDIESNLKDLIPKIGKLNELFEEIKVELKIPLPATYNNVPGLIRILNLSGQSPVIPEAWILQNEISDLLLDAKKYSELQNGYLKARNHLSTNYDEAIFLINGKVLKHTILSKVDILKEGLNSTGYNEANLIVKQLTEIKIKAQNFEQSIKNAIDEAHEVSLILGIEPPQKFKSVNELCDLVDLILSNPKPTEIWFDESKKDLIYHTIAEGERKFRENEKLLSKILNDFDSDVVNIDFNPMLKRFRTDYKSIFKIFKSSYRTDKKLLLGLLRANTRKIDDSLCIDILTRLKTLSENNQWINENRKKLIEYFGTHYIGEPTNWDNIKNSVVQFYKIISFFKEKGTPARIKELLLNGNLQRQDLKQKIQSCEKLIIDECEYNLKHFLHDTQSQDRFIANYLSSLKVISEAANILSSNYNEFLLVSKNPTDYDTAIADLDLLIRQEATLKDLEQKKEELQQHFSTMYKGMETDWQLIIEALNFAQDLKLLVDTYDLPNEFVKKVCTDKESIINFKKTELVLTALLDGTTQNFEWFSSLFNELDFKSVFLAEFHNRAKNCLLHLSLLEEWIDFRNNRDECRRNGLSEYIAKIEESKIKPELIQRIFLKRFFRLWLDINIQQFPAVNSFRRKSYEEAIAEFKQLDQSQITIARSRVKAKLISNLPDLNIATASKDEVGILKKELTKQRKLLPLRKLFIAIPNLLTALKPCLMMSPLSVSVFLEADNYEFDLIIFDEASQIRTEDAIGTIMRGKQVIIVGDSNQLPPTNFFGSGTSDSDYDNEEEGDDDIGAYESILDEAVKALPEKGLRWHYRSKHEHLIAFSNAEIYRHSLITFPSNTDKVKDNGVEYIYEPNGLYDRGGKTNNIIEAKRIIELVRDHIIRFPNRSLGIVTFSGSQKLTIEGLIDKFKMENSQFDFFFSPLKEEYFFVKNLENVQGDERDTIIFSIGYGKDANGRMWQNYGPLGNPGGNRRLNVAITRAKHNVKLVGSIKPTDIISTKEGVIMLRSYIDFAINGESALRRQTVSSDDIVLESPFEESVYEFLKLKNFSVVTQVGCSGYRLDMAIKHPTLNGVFVLGIECDGATYHSSRTARDRDRLRQTVLEDMGWKIYRIWSTDWIKDTQTEGEKLLNAIEEALNSYQEPSVDTYAEEDLASLKQPVLNQYETIDNGIRSNSEKVIGYGFIEYQEADITLVAHNYDFDTYLASVILHVVNVEYPIHFENLCRRVASVFNNQKATSKVRDHVNYLVQRKIDQKLKFDGQFISPIDKSEIPVRVPIQNEPARQIQYISELELAKAMYIIAGKTYGIKADDLINTTGRELGYKRITENIRYSLNEGLKHLISTNRIKEDGERKIIVLD